MLALSVFCRLKKQHGCPWKGLLKDMEVCCLVYQSTVLVSTSFLFIIIIIVIIIIIIIIIIKTVKILLRPQ